MFFDRQPGRLVRRKSERPFPGFDGLITKSGLLVKDGQVFDGRKVLGIDLDGCLQFADGVVHLPLLSVQ